MVVPGNMINWKYIIVYFFKLWLIVFFILIAFFEVMTEVKSCSFFYNFWTSQKTHINQKSSTFQQQILSLHLSKLIKSLGGAWLGPWVWIKPWGTFILQCLGRGHTHWSLPLLLTKITPTFGLGTCPFCLDLLLSFNSKRHTLDKNFFHYQHLVQFLSIFPNHH